MHPAIHGRSWPFFPFSSPEKEFTQNLKSSGEPKSPPARAIALTLLSNHHLEFTMTLQPRSLTRPFECEMKAVATTIKPLLSLSSMAGELLYAGAESRILSADFRPALMRRTFLKQAGRPCSLDTPAIVLVSYVRSDRPTVPLMVVIPHLRSRRRLPERPCAVAPCHPPYADTSDSARTAIVKHDTHTLQPGLPCSGQSTTIRPSVHIKRSESPPMPVSSRRDATARSRTLAIRPEQDRTGEHGSTPGRTLKKPENC